MTRNTMTRRAVLLLMIAAVFALSGCEKISSMFGSKQDAEITAAYQAYRSAMLSGDIQTIKGLLVKEKAQELDRPEAAQMLSLAKAFMPPTAEITGIAVQGDAATLTASSMDGANTIQGTIHMLKQDGKWKVYDENWNMQINMQAGAGQPAPQADIRRPYEFEKLTGTWKGHEAGRSGDDWEITLGSAYDVAATGPGGENYRGDATVDDNLGVENNSTRVLPGGAPFDLRITASSHASHIGKMSLGSYKLMGDVLQLCGSEPGVMKRTSDFASSGSFRCFELRRVSGPIVMNKPAAPPEPQQPAQPFPSTSSSSKQDPGVTGEAIVVKDGKTETYPLVTGFFSSTRFANPSRAIIQFQAPAPEHSNARRIEMTLDATRTGTHYADGKLLNDTFMGEEKLKIGERTSQGYTASFRWLADGGQIFFPKTSCIVTVNSAYTGSPSSEFSGEVRDCAVHSAGIDYQISSVKFTMRGAPKR